MYIPGPAMDDPARVPTGVNLCRELESRDRSGAASVRPPRTCARIAGHQQVGTSECDGTREADSFDAAYLIGERRGPHERNSAYLFTCPNSAIPNSAM